MKKYIIGLILMFSALINIHSQVVYEHISNENIYDYLDELATEGWIEINSVIKPYSRNFIAEKLEEAEGYRNEMSQRQSKELDFYLTGFTLELHDRLSLNPKVNFLKKTDGFGIDINPLGGFYQDKLFSFQIQPVYGYNMFNNDNGTESFSYGGLQGYGYIGEHVGVYASLRDHHSTTIFNKTDYLTPMSGGNFKYRDGGVDWSEMRGGVTFSWNWGEIGVIKDHFEWGTNTHGANIFSGKQPSFAQIAIKLKPAYWLEFNYVHGWLVSEVVDSARSYWDGTSNDPRYRSVFRKKWMTANMFTVRPIKGLNVSIGNSIVYSDVDHPAFWMPIFVYKPIDHTYNATDSYGQAGQNSQLFADVSVRLIRHLHLYGALYSDEIKFDRMKTDSLHNFWSWKGGFQLSNFVVNNYEIGFEYSKTLPGTFQHPISTTTFESNNYNMGYYLRDNSDEIYFYCKFKPIRGLHIKGEAFIARHGPDEKYEDGNVIVAVPFMEEVSWKNTTYALNIKYEVVNNVYVWANATISNIEGDEELVKKWTPEFYIGNQTTLSGGFNIGF
ncbi:hypothetical protein [Lentimicrobium sp. S6]|uniref:hypothetical protein n=1 Tax=Lentimicrobium sp. S6 TaxID=2735872 RepID=UPI001557CFBA|nr:hypothetical protein [Lentimicrobium sp. S6]NPD46372.1 hypothetical protein [Lentimicrobium sp. S6]